MGPLTPARSGGDFEDDATAAGAEAGAALLGRAVQISRPINDHTGVGDFPSCPGSEEVNRGLGPQAVSARR